MRKRWITRRDFIKTAGLSAGAALLAACNLHSQPVAEQTTITKVQQVDEKATQTAAAIPQPTQPAEPIELDVWWDADDPDLTLPWKTAEEIEKQPEFTTMEYNGGYARQLFPPWLEQHPGVKLKITAHDWGNWLLVNILKAVAAGLCPDTTIDEIYVNELARLGVYQPLPDRYKNLFPDSTIGGAVLGGRAYALPGRSGTNSLGINLDALEKAGLPLDRFPATWEELVVDARKVSASGQANESMNIAYYWWQPETVSGNYGTPMRVLPWFNQNNAPLSDEDGNPTANTREAVETWLWHNQLMQTSAGAYANYPDGIEDDRLEFCAGRIAYIMGWSDHWTWVGKTGANAVAVDLPLPPGGKPGNVPIGNVFYAACTGGKHPDLGFSMVTEIYTREDCHAYYPQYIGIWVPAIKSLLEQWETYDQLGGYKTESAKQMARASMKALLLGNAQALSPWPKNVDAIWMEWNKSYQRIWEGRLDAEEIKAELDQLQSSIEGLLA